MKKLIYLPQAGNISELKFCIVPLNDASGTGDMEQWTTNSKLSHKLQYAPKYFNIVQRLRCFAKDYDNFLKDLIRV